MRNTLQDVRYAWRQLKHAPGFTAVAVLTLALGIGASTAIVGILSALVVTSRPTVSLDGLYSVVKRSARPGYSETALTTTELRALDVKALPGAAGVTAAGMSLAVTIQMPGRAEYVPAGLVPGTFGRFFGLTPQAGRWILPADDEPGANQVMVISDRLWRSWFGGKPDIVGQASVRVNLQAFTVVGVAPAIFRSPGDAYGSDVWLPFSSISTILDTTMADRYLQLYGMTNFIRPRSGVTAAQLAAEVRAALPNATVAAYSGLEKRWPATVDVVPTRTITRDVTGSREMWLAVALAILILIAACANLANLVYARGLQRTSEVAVRAALGASTGRLLRLFVAETAILAALASSAGLALALGVMQLFARAVPAFQVNSFGQIQVDLSPDLNVFAYAFGAGALTALVIGVTTAWRMSRVPPLRVLAGSGAGLGLTARGGRTRTALVAIQITVAVLLVMTASVSVERYQQDRARSGPPTRARYDERLLASARVDLDLLHYNETRGRAFFDQLIAKARTLPGVEGAALASSLWGGGLTNLETEPPSTGRVGSPTLVRVSTTRVSPGYLQTLGLPLTRGRDVTAFDVDGAPKVALVSESAVAHLFPRGDDPIGKRVKFGPWDWLTIVGVTSDAVSSDDTGPTRPSNTMYIPFAQWYQAKAQIVVRSQAPDAVLEPLRLAVNEIDPDVAVFDATTSERYFQRNQGVRSAFDALITSLGAVALGIAMLGVYGVVAYFVSVRRREFGIRLALGATRGRVIRLVVDHAIHVVLIGLLPGVLMASLGARFAMSQRSDFTPMEIGTWFIVPGLILVAGIVAGYLPARRAASVDPNVALRDL